MKKRASAKSFFDTNVLLYAFGQQDTRSETARRLVEEGGVVGVQVLNEFAAVARRKLRMSWVEVVEALAAIRVLCPSPVSVSIETHEAAMRIAERYGYSIYDALIVSAALETNCGTLYSEDICDGQVIEGLTIRNPFRRV